MPKVSPIQSNFNGGEVSPLAYGRVQEEFYKRSLAVCKNYLPLIQGPITRRPGTAFVFHTKDSTKASRLVPFEFSITQAYMLEFGNQYIRFYKNNGIITNAVKNITAITKANPAVVTSNGHGFTNGTHVVIAGVLGMTELNNREFTVANVATNTFELSGVDSSGYTTYTSGGTAAEIYEISSPYLSADLPTIQYTQSNDVLYLVGGAYAPRKLIRTADNSWLLVTITFVDGPYLDIPGTDINGAIYLRQLNTGSPLADTLSAGFNPSTGDAYGISNTVNNGSGLIRVTVSASVSWQTGFKIYITGVTGTTEANGTWTVTFVDSTHFDLQGSVFVNAFIGGGTVFAALFAATDVGRLVRFYDSSWKTATILTRVHPGRVTVNWTVGANIDTHFTASWRLGAWSDTTGWPQAITFHQDRLVFGAANSDPTTFDGSSSSDYENFSPSDTSGTITAADAYRFTLNSNDVNGIKWFTSDEQTLLIGTTGGEWRVAGADGASAISATSIDAKKATSYGSDGVQAVQSGKCTIFVQRGKQQVRELNYYFDVTGYRAADLTQVAEHITSSGILYLAVQKVPQPIVWGVRADGVLIAMTYERELDSLKVGWSRHVPGGTSPLVESVAIIPSADGTTQDVWMIINRQINGTTARYVEYLKPIFKTNDVVSSAFFVDSGLTYNSTPTTTITGLNHLNGQTVAILADGSPQANQGVVAGKITLSAAASKVTVGLPYNSDGQKLRTDAGAADGTAMGKTRRTHRVGIMLLNTLGFKLGPDFNSLDDITLTDNEDGNYNQAQGLYTGIRSENISEGYDLDNTFCWRQSQPLPGTVQGIYPQMVTQDRG